MKKRKENNNMPIIYMKSPFCLYFILKLKYGGLILNFEHKLNLLEFKISSFKEKVRQRRKTNEF